MPSTLTLSHLCIAFIVAEPFETVTNFHEEVLQALKYFLQDLGWLLMIPSLLSPNFPWILRVVSAPQLPSTLIAPGIIGCGAGVGVGVSPYK